MAAIGYDWIHRAQRYLAYLLIAILSGVTIGAVLVIRLPAAQFDLQGFRGVPFLAQFFAAAAYQLSWSIYVSDYSRYLPHDVGVRASFWWTYVGAFIGATWTMLCLLYTSHRAITRRKRRPCQQISAHASIVPFQQAPKSDILRRCLAIELRSREIALLDAQDVERLKTVGIQTPVGESLPERGRDLRTTVQLECKLAREARPQHAQRSVCLLYTSRCV